MGVHPLLDRILVNRFLHSEVGDKPMVASMKDVEAMHKQKRVLVLPKGLRLHTIPKVASTSISQAMNHLPVDTWNRDWADGGDANDYRFMVVRHPSERMRSNYRYFIKEYVPHRFNTQNWQNIGLRPGMPYGEFVDRVCSSPYFNTHIYPQIYWASVAWGMDRIVKLEALNKVWPSLQERFGYLKDIEVANKTEDAPDETYECDEEFIQMIYAHDYEMYWGAENG